MLFPKTDNLSSSLEDEERFKRWKINLLNFCLLFIYGLSSQRPFFSNFHCLLLCHLAKPKVINYQLFSRENNLQCLYLMVLLWDAFSFLLYIHEGDLTVFDGKGEMAEPFINSSLKSVSETWIPLGFVVISFLWVNQDCACCYLEFYYSYFSLSFPHCNLWFHHQDEWL